MFSHLRRVTLALGVAAAGLAGPAAAEEPISYKEDVVPVVQIRCLECHQPGGDGFVKSGLDLSSYAGLMKGTKFGPVVVPGDALTSNFMVVVDGRGSQAIRMPHERKKLTKCEIDILRRWISTGAKNN